MALNPPTSGFSLTKAFWNTEKQDSEILLQGFANLGLLQKKHIFFGSLHPSAEAFLYLCYPNCSPFQVSQGHQPHMGFPAVFVLPFIPHVESFCHCLSFLHKDCLLKWSLPSAPPLPSLTKKLWRQTEQLPGHTLPLSHDENLTRLLNYLKPHLLYLWNGDTDPGLPGSWWGPRG